MSKADRGFATLKKRDPARQREIAAMGGKASHAQGTAHQWDSDEASVAGKKGAAEGHRRRVERGEIDE